MKLILGLTLIFFIGCTKSQPTPVITPIKDIACAVEKAISGGLGATIASNLSCTHPDLVSADLQAAFGNANMCATPIATSSLLKSAAAWKTIGDIPAEALKPKAIKSEAQVQGIIGALVCPMAVQSPVGFLSNSVPAKWGCTGPNASFQGLVSALISACTVVVPI